MRKSTLAITLALAFYALLAFLTPLSSAAHGPFPATVTDISDRDYEPAVIKLLDAAKESIVISMYIINVREKGPVRLLVRDLEEALNRGVSVEIYINTRPGHGMPSSGAIDELFRSVTSKGAKLHKVTPDYLLHDKLIIVDSRYVVNGSTNWSVAALKSNYESTELIDSPELAKAKLHRLRQFRLEGDKKKTRPAPVRPKGLESLPAGAIISVDKELLTNRRYFPSMLMRHADRTMDSYLLLLSEAARRGEKEFFVSLEDIAVSSGMSPGWSDTALRRQMIKELKALQDKYALINVDFSYGKDAWVELKELPGGTFNVTGDLFSPKRLASLSQPAKFVYLMKALLMSEGTSVDAFTVSDLCKRFGIGEFSMRKGLQK